MKKILVLALTACLVNLTACGFALRGTQVPQTQSAIKVGVISEHSALDKLLRTKLKLLGFTDNPTAKITNISFDNVQLKSYPLVGVLTEIRMVLSANVVYTLPDGRTHTAPMLVERSYQYNENDVASGDRQATQVRQTLYEVFADRVSEQYLALTQTP